MIYSEILHAKSNTAAYITQASTGRRTMKMQQNQKIPPRCRKLGNSSEGGRREQPD